MPITVSRAGGLSIGGLAEASGVHLETIRYYERIGLIPEPPRTGGGHRVYGEAHLGRLVFVRRARELGFTLDQVRSLLPSPTTETGAAPRRGISGRHGSPKPGRRSPTSGAWSACSTRWSRAVPTARYPTAR